MVACVVAALVASAALYGIRIAALNGGQRSVQSQGASLADETILALAHAHWKAIGQKNVSAVMSQYSTHYEGIWWDVNGGVFDQLNGKHDCNVVTGPGNCSAILASTWSAFFNDTREKSLNYSLCGVTPRIGLDSTGSVTATLWISLAKGEGTLKVPYEIDFSNINGTWQLQRDTFGYPGSPATFFSGQVSPGCTTTAGSP